MLKATMASDAAFDGRFVTGVLTTGIYCLPSCKARKPKPENISFFSHASGARQAGLRACLRCRPDDFGAGAFRQEALIEATVKLLFRAPGAFRRAGDLARAAKVSVSTLHDLVRTHFQTTPARLLRRARVRASGEQLLRSGRSISEVAFENGFESLSAFNLHFREQMRMTPSAFRELPISRSFSITLPSSFDHQTVLGYLGRDPLSQSDRVSRNVFETAVFVDGRLARLRIELGASTALCSIEGSAPSAAVSAEAHAIALRRLGLRVGPDGFDHMIRHLPDADRLVFRPGLRVPLTSTPFDAMLWAVVGQQVNLRFAFTLMRALVDLCGTDAGDGMRTMPRPVDVAALSLAALQSGQFSRAKASYVTGVATAVLEGGIRGAHDSAHDSVWIDALSATRVERELMAVRGIGVWSARYIMMRGYGFEDCVPVGDAGLERSLMRAFSLEQRPDHEQTESLMARFSPFRTLATFYLWQSLNEPAA